MIDDPTLKMQFLFSLRKAGIVDKQVLNAMERVDRKNFVNRVFSEKAYDDTPLPIACGQTISQPTIVGIMTQALQVSICKCCFISKAVKYYYMRIRVIFLKIKSQITTNKACATSN